MFKNRILHTIIAVTFITVWFDSLAYTLFATHNPSYIWNHQPPADADIMNVDFLCLKRVKDGSQSFILGSTDIKIKNDSVYFPFYQSLSIISEEEYSYEYAEVQNWISGIMNGDEIIFKNMDVHSILIDSIKADVIYPEETIEYVDTTNVYYRAIKEFNNPHSYSNTVGTEDKWGSNVTYLCSEEDVVGKCDLDKGLFHNFNNSLCIASKNASSIGFESVSGAGTKCWPVPGCIIDEFITGHISSIPPTSLPAPRLSYGITTSSGHSMGGLFWTDNHAMLDFKMSIVMSDHSLINPRKLYIKLFKNGEEIADLSFLNYGNPFNYANRYKYELGKWGESTWSGETGENPLIDNVIEALVYYKNPDGTTVESPKARLDYPETGNSIADIPMPDPVCDGKTYDLTGREVNPIALSPGIYIRNGRKFAVGR